MGYRKVHVDRACIVPAKGSFLSDESVYYFTTHFALFQKFQEAVGLCDARSPLVECDIPEEE